jgi:uncharacterized protein YqhQ
VTAAADKVRLGGMALPNGVLVHGPHSWACAIRSAGGELELASGEKSVRSADVESPLLRGLVRVAELLAVLPAVRRALPEAELPFRQGRVMAAMAGCALAAKGLRASRLGPVGQETAAALLALVPVTTALRGTELAAYHGAEHISIGSYEHGRPRPREHERCGSHLLGPLLVSTVVGNVAAGKIARTPTGRTAARLLAGAVSVAAATELYGWALRNPGTGLSRALSWPGHELQRRFLTAEPTAEQLEVAQAALDECLRLELGRASPNQPPQ